MGCRSGLEHEGEKYLEIATLEWTDALTRSFIHPSLCPLDLPKFSINTFLRFYKLEIATVNAKA